MNRITKIFALAVGAVVGLGAANNVLAAPSSTPTEVIDATIGSVIDELIEIVTFVITNYTGYILAFVAIVGMYVYFRKFANLGSK